MALCFGQVQNASVQVGDAVALIKGRGKNMRRKERRSRIEQIRASLGLSDSQRTPLVVYQYLLIIPFSVHLFKTPNSTIFYMINAIHTRD